MSGYRDYSGELLMDIRRTGGSAALAIVVLLLPCAAGAQQGVIHFTGRLAAPAAPLTAFVAGVHVLPDGNAARKREEALSVALAEEEPPELLTYFAGYAGREARLSITMYE